MHRALISLLLGFAATVVVAWACVTWSAPDHGVRCNLGPQPWYRPDGHAAPLCDARTIGSGPGLRVHVSSGSTLTDGVAITDSLEEVIEAGWPFCALFMRSVATPTVQSSWIAPAAPKPWEHSLPRPEWLPEPRHPFAAAGLPFGPIWSGFLADALLFSALFWLAGSAATAARHWHRTRRGLCAGCAHALAGSAICPECGRAAPASLQVRSAA